MSKALVKAVRTGLTRLVKKGKMPSTNRERTAAVKRALCKACLKVHREAWVGASGVDMEGVDGEWLYDVTCLKYERPDYYLRRTLLVAEIEWSRGGDIWRDFEKLPIAQADVRVMVFDSKWLRDCKDPFQEFKEYIKRLETVKATDTYLVAAWCDDHFEYWYRGPS